ARGRHRAVSRRPPLRLGDGGAVARGRLHPYAGAGGSRSAMRRRVISLNRFRAVLVKEFIQMLRDRLTFAMMGGEPIMQLMLFGYAINSDPRALPTAVVLGDNGTLARSIVRALENTTYFRVVAWPDSPAQADEMIALGEVQFVVDIPVDFSHR